MSAMMKCGCAAQATTNNWGGVKYDPPIPCCAVHDCIEVDPAPPDLTGRMANCAYGKHAIVPSSPDLAFFEHRHERETDCYYCGCRGWD